MNLTPINPWQWQANFGYAQAVSVQHHSQTLYCSGQAALDADGKPLGGRLSEQLQASLQNLETVIQQAGYDPAHIVRLNFYTTSIPDFFGAYGAVVAWLSAYGIMPASTLVEVTALAFPELTIEIEATVVG
ncbi:RidA family protein [Spirosoma koreense]